MFLCLFLPLPLYLFDNDEISTSPLHVTIKPALIRYWGIKVSKCPSLLKCWSSHKWIQFLDTGIFIYFYAIQLKILNDSLPVFPPVLTVWCRTRGSCCWWSWCCWRCRSCCSSPSSASCPPIRGQPRLCSPPITAHLLQSSLPESPPPPEPIPRQW